MSGRLHDAGWYTSTINHMKNASLGSVISEDVHNIEHYYKLHGETAPTPVLLFVSTQVTDADDGMRSIFLRASNMPYTEDILERRFTAFASKPTRAVDPSSKAEVSTHGYGAILPSMFIGGTMQVQFKDGKWKTSSLNIEEQRREAFENDTLSSFPSKCSLLPVGTSPLIQQTSLWNEQTIALFKKHNICTLELHESPSYNGKTDMRDEIQFLQFLETLQCQFEDLLLEGKVHIVGVFCKESECEEISLPYNFFRRLHDTHSQMYPFPYSPFASQQLECRRTFDFMYANKDVYVRTLVHGEYVYAKMGDKIEPIEPMQFTPQYTVWIGRSPKSNQDYARLLTADKQHPLHLPSTEDYAGGISVNLIGYRMTVLPIRGYLVSQVRDLPHSSRLRIGVNIHDRRTKDLFIDAREHKTRSGFQLTGFGSYEKNVIVDSINKLCSLLKKYKKQDDELGDETLRKAFVVDPATQRTQRRRAVGAGIRYEANIAQVLRDSLPYRVTDGDTTIRRTFLSTTDSQYSGIDILVEPTEELAVAIQCKRMVRVSANDYRTFLRTFRYAVACHPTKRVAGLFVVHKNELEHNEGFWELVSTPGVNLVCIKENELTPLTTIIENIVGYHCDSPSTPN